MADQEIPQQETTVRLEDYVRIILSRAWIIILALVIVVGATLCVSLATTPQYRASAQVIYRPNDLEGAVSGYELAGYSSYNDRIIESAVTAINNDLALAEAVKAQLGSAEAASSYMDIVEVTTEKGSDVVGIDATSADPEEAADVANAYAEQFVIHQRDADRAVVVDALSAIEERISQLDTADYESGYALILQEKAEDLRILESMQNGRFLVLSRAAVPDAPYTPQITRNVILALIVGLVLGVGLAFLLEYFDKRIKDEKMLEAELGVPVLAGIPLITKRRTHGDEEPGAPVGFTDSPVMLEAFRTLRSSLQYFNLDTKQNVWLITSGMPQEGKSITTANLGLSLALSGKRVVVLEADLRRPMVHEYLAISQEPGLSNLLAGNKRMGDVLQFIKADRFMPRGNQNQAGEDRSAQLQRNLYAIASGPLPPNPAELLASERMTKLIESLVGMTDCLLIDTAPVLAVSDALTVARHADGVIVVSRMGEATKDQIREMRAIFERSGTRVIGAVAMGVRRSPSYYRRQSYGYVYGQSG
ncbi:MAG: hypothetical protein JW990_07250 [Thermoleophilia bacterium]|nr:hypothetical protein [Thermoleophilia bacterium]